MVLCPACGGTPKVVVNKKNLFTKRKPGYMIRCSKCGYTTFFVGDTADEAWSNWKSQVV